MGLQDATSLSANVIGKFSEVSASGLKITPRKVDPPDFDVDGFNWQTPTMLFRCDLATQTLQQQFGRKSLDASCESSQFSPQQNLF